jgi:hypothetical protein
VNENNMTLMKSQKVKSRKTFSFVRPQDFLRPNAT